MSRSAAWMICLLLASCTRPPPEGTMPSTASYVYVLYKIAAQLINLCFWVITPCDNMKREDQCVRFSQPRRIRGLWRNDFEGSVFCAAPAKECSSRNRDAMWL